MKNQDQEILQLLVLLTDYFDINVWFLASKMRLKISRNLLRQISLVTLTVCSTSVMIILFMQQNKINICNSLKKFLIRYERKDWSLTLKSVNLVKFLLRPILFWMWNNLQIQVKFVVFWVLLLTVVNLFQISQLLLNHWGD